MKLTGRVRTLEHKGAPAAVCPICLGRGRPGLSLRFAGEARPAPRGCPACGRCGTQKVIHIDRPRGDKWGPQREPAAAARGPAGRPRGVTP